MINILNNDNQNNKYEIQSTTEDKLIDINTKHNKSSKKEIFIDTNINYEEERIKKKDKKRKEKEEIKEKEERKAKRRKEKELIKSKNKKIEIENNRYVEKNAHNDYSDFNNVGFIEKKIDIPIKYGSKWTDDDRKKLVNMLKNSSKIIISLDDNTKNNIFEYSPNNNSENNFLIKKIADKLDRTEGGIRAEIKKIIFEDYIRGKTTEQISENLNLTYKNIKSVIKIQLDKECDNEILLLEKENKLLKLKLENKKLKNELSIFNN